MKKTSAVLLSWKRQENLPEIIKDLREVPWIDDIVVWNNDYDNHLAAESLGVDVVKNSSENVYTLGRFYGCRLARHDTIYVQDDDVIQQNKGGIWKAWQESEGERLATAMSSGHERLHRKHKWGKAHEVLLGWGAIFNRLWIPRVLDGYRKRYGIDTVLQRKADRLFTALLCRDHSVVRSVHTELPGSRTRDLALYLEDDHSELNEIARERVRELIPSG